MGFLLLVITLYFLISCHLFSQYTFFYLSCWKEKFYYYLSKEYGSCINTVAFFDWYLCCCPNFCLILCTLYSTYNSSSLLTNTVRANRRSIIVSGISSCMAEICLFKGNSINVFEKLFQFIMALNYPTSWNWNALMVIIQIHDNSQDTTWILTHSFL